MRIGIIGASSQVGSSIALYLKHFTAEEVICFIRSEYSGIFFELFGIGYERVDFTNVVELQQKLTGLDVVIDCSYPSGQLYAILPAIRNNFNAIIAAMPEKAVFIYMSSIMAFGMPPGESRLKHYNLPRSSYAYIKRKAEKEMEQLCKKYEKKGFVFRLSQVHGFLQSVNSSFREKLSSASVAFINGSPEDLTNTVFINSVCEAIIKCAKGEVSPGLYTLVSQPQWTLEQLYSYYTVNYDIDCSLQYFKAETRPAPKKSLIAGLFGTLKKFRPLLETYVLMQSPKASIIFKGRYRQSEVIRTVNNGAAAMQAIDFNLLGPVPFSTISNISSSVSEVTAFEKKLETFYNKVITDNWK